ncbi:ABC transporter ATP-binding protein [Halalkalibacterium halodurans]|uniref:ABC transporter (ATP-binding protein) n=1 Tax=Halalkalibacterium halodurans (strain ATCC BAA-125 / DSM 18197 / FERM 7344 / JCM 9153 / C-125) TaxID=272558 RepID=Q9KEY6_HALH5|nr:ABC transporter ATP-binding protein [Halalkalibacterium halodurans]MED4080339.1 ABC transporter ATP-binding protein [Halalkalibacterium halodurans]MED4084597.1 ABC transporter ATP-binding protein [Halalkalibacterium halodurans]MED4104839.1 ABC transporter ATP-binding protein [Halalkalibacterium halodurans]MED4109720.1 ABC transporter ATP-binding protein [Halalkalibacterium halodurans]MED4122956.1 ABC transporter ATP-binding protein [Halalkalibacterium halodurans]
MEKQQQTSLKPFFSLILSTNIPKVALTFGLIGSLITTLVGLTIPLLTREMVDGFSLESLNTLLIAAIIVVFILQAVLDGLSMYALAYVGQKIVARLRERMWFKLLRLPVNYFDKNTSGQTVSRVVNDTGIVKDLISQHFPQFVGGIITIIGAVIILFIMDWKMTLLMFIAVPITVAVMVPLGMRMSKISRGLQDETANFTGNVQQTLSEIRLMKASNAEQTEEKKGLTGIEKLFSFGLREGKIFALIAPLMYLVVMVVIVIIIGYGGIRVAEGTMTTGSLVAFLLYLFQIIFPITSFTMFFTQLQKAKGATERIIEILDIEEENGQQGLEMDISNKAIHVKNVSFAYNEEEPVIQKVSFDVEPGTMVAFAGPSGGGKTTMFGLLERFYEPTSGEILIGDTSIQELSMYSWRKQIGYVSQDSPMMVGTIRENLCYGLEDRDDIDDDRLWEVAKMAYADQFISEFPKGLDTEVGERGVKLSGGQRQRIAIARAFLRDPKILMMDEATASLDSQSEGIVQQALTRLMEGRTTFVIAHRLSTIVNADKIIFIEKGQITGIGTHQELVQTHDLYREFAEQQLT